MTKKKQLLNTKNDKTQLVYATFIQNLLSSFLTFFNICLSLFVSFFFFTLLSFYLSLTRNSLCLCLCLCLVSFKSKHSSPDGKSSTIINYSPSPAPNNLPADTAHFPGLERRREREEERQEMDKERLKER